MRKVHNIISSFVLASSISLAVAAKDESPMEFNIDAASLAQALEQFSAQTNLQVMFASNLAGLEKSISLSGSFTPLQALSKLLEGTGLEYVFDGKANIAIRPRAAMKNIPASKGPTTYFLPPGEAGTVFEELVVIAQKRTEPLFQVPIAISVFGPENIRHTSITQLRELSGYPPNVQISRGRDFSSTVAIRGVGSGSHHIGFDTRAGVYLDGVYMGQSPAVNQELNDLERIEVLRGPQGMLFGKNTVAGAISLVSQKPMDEFAGHVNVSVGNLDALKAEGSLNIPLSNSVAARISASRNSRNGYVENLTTGTKLNDRDVAAYRVQLRLHIAENFLANLAFDDMDAKRFSFLGEPISDPFANTADLVAPEKDEVSFNDDTFEKRDIRGTSLNLEYSFANHFTLKSISALRNTEMFLSGDADHSPTDWATAEYADQYGQISQEFQLLSPNQEGPLSYVAGLYYYRQHAETHRERFNGEASFQFGNMPGTTIINDGHVITRSYAGYFNGSYDLAPKLELGLGLRYTNETKEVDWLLDGSKSNIPNIATTDDNYRGKRSDRYTDYALSLSYAFNDTINSYIKYSTGFKSGGYDLGYISSATLAAGIEFDKETAGSFEVGVKNRFLNNRVIVNLAAFQSLFEDYQVYQHIDLGANTTAITIRNAAEVETKGLEAELIYRPTDQLEIQASAGYLDARFKDFPGGLTNGSNAAGNHLPDAPEFNYSLSAQYFHAMLALEAELLLRADATYTSGHFTTVDNVKTYRLRDGSKMDYGYVEGMTLINARAGWLPFQRNWEAYMWGRNLTDERGPIDSMRDQYGTLGFTYAEPRTYGVEVSWNF